MSVPKVVAVIGGGPTGFAAARALVSERFKVRIFERRSEPGGVWVYTGNGPMYKDLDTNIFKELMEYRDRAFPQHLPRYVSREDVLKYVGDYSREIASHKNTEVLWNTEVTQLSKHNNQWHLKLSDPSDPQTSKNDEVADYVVVASGHYEVPYFPPIPGLREFGEKTPSKLTHSRYYTDPDRFRNQKVLMVGNGSSGVDITIQLLSVTAPITVSRRKEAKSDEVFESDVDVIWKPEATAVDPDTGEVTFADGTKDTFDVILVAAGYLYRLPFLESTESGSVGQDLVDPEAQRVRNLHKFMFYIQDPSIAFVGLNKQVVPMPFAESQAAVIARVWSGRLQLPPTKEMQAEEDQLIKEKGTGPEYFHMGYPVDAEYMHLLNDWADSAGEGGFFAERWGPEKLEMRSKIAEEKLGEYKRKKAEAVAQRQASH